MKTIVRKVWQKTMEILGIQRNGYGINRIGKESLAVVSASSGGKCVQPRLL